SVLHSLGALYYQRGELDSALSLVDQAVSEKPDNPHFQITLGAVLRARGQTLEAVQAFRRAAELDPNLEVAFYNLGNTLRDIGGLEDAVNAYKAYLEIKPQDALVHSVLGDTYRMMEKDEEAIESYEIALSYDVDRAGDICNIAGIMRDRGWYHAAYVLIREAAEKRNPSPDLLRSRGLLALQFGDLQQGWADKENRFESSTERIFLRPTPPVYWGGEDLSGKSILVWTEQGLGDEVLHGSMLPDVVARAQT
ncbi:MAG: tetratricopeptide repeat protein, partial [Rhodospirillaceae bacterium]